MQTSIIVAIPVDATVKILYTQVLDLISENKR